ncbi:hypothetical protein NX059_009725 [Plenodomus lindquistii]|nr:hypothetical protein NX059_009725 [Plenodomus lindquistii]
MTKTSSSDAHDLLQRLQQPWKFVGTPTQAQRRRDQALGRKVWNEVLEEFRTFKAAVWVWHEKQYHARRAIEKAADAIVDKGSSSAPSAEAVKASEEARITVNTEERLDRDLDLDPHRQEAKLLRRTAWRVLAAAEKAEGKVGEATKKMSEDTDGDSDEGMAGDTESQLPDPFPSFFSLPLETRDMVYEYYMEIGESSRRTRQRYTNPYSRPSGSTGSIHWQYLSKLAHEKKYKEELRRERVGRVDEKRLKLLEDDHSFTASARAAFEEYQLDHAMYSRRCFHEDHGGAKNTPEDPGQEKNGNADAVWINERGNLCDDLPLLSLVNHQIFRETFFLYYSRPKKGLWFSWKVQTLNFFPLLRFWQALTNPLLRAVDEDDRLQLEQIFIVIDTSEDAHEELDECGKRFDHVKRLIELHWLEGLPLWGCFTGLHDDREIGPLQDWLYSVHQIVALHRADRARWKQETVKVVHKASFDNIVSAKNWKTCSDAKFLEGAIEMLHQAILIHLGCEIDFRPRSRDGAQWSSDGATMLRYAGFVRVKASAEGKVFLLVVRRHCTVMNKLLREKLGEEYKKWELYADREVLPKHITL